MQITIILLQSISNKDHCLFVVAFSNIKIVKIRLRKFCMFKMFENTQY